jgi:folate-binding protein YgfZ
MFAVVRRTIVKCPTTQQKQLVRKISFAIPDRAYVEITGKDTTKFLQGICTNDISKLTNHGDCLAAAFLTTKGRVLADAIMYNVIDKDEADKAGSATSSGKRSIVLEIHSSAVAGLIKYLSMYRLRSSVKVTDASSKYSTVLFTKYGSKNEPQPPADAEGTILVTAVDPRIASLGARILLTSSSPPFVPDEASVTRARAQYLRLRLLHGIAEGPEIVNKIPLECNMDMLNYIDFTKGCYVGQELIARTKFKGLVRKRLLPFIRKSFLLQLGKSSSHHETAFVPLTGVELADLLPVDQPTGTGTGTDTGTGTGTETMVGMKVIDASQSAASSSGSNKGEVGEGEGGKDPLGEVIASDGWAGVALVRLGQVLPVPRNEQPTGALATLSCVSSAPSSSSTESAIESAIESGKGSVIESQTPPTGPDPTSPTTAEPHPIVIHKPVWWIDKDPLTGMRTDTHESTIVLPF